MSETKLEAVEIYGFQFSLTPLAPAQERIRELEGQLEDALTTVDNFLDLKEELRQALTTTEDSNQQLSAELRELQATVDRLTESLAESETELREAEHRLERVRGVVRAAVEWKEADGSEASAKWLYAASDRLTDMADALDALTPEDREWAEEEDS